MSGHESKANPLLLLLCVLLILCCGGLLTESSSAPYVNETEESSAVIAAEQYSSINALGGMLRTPTPSPIPTPEATSVPTLTPTSSPTPVPRATAAPIVRESVYSVSPESQEGEWVPQGESWMFMVNGAAYTGWLNDADGKRYYLDSDGLMHTGWLELDGKSYYLDQDGIMQTGSVTIEGETYTFFPSGVLDDGSGDIETESGKESELKTEKDNEKGTDAEESTQAVLDQEASTLSSAEKKYLALTFDDGPSEFTDRLLDCLEKNHAKATFFLVGKEIPNFPDAVERMETLGCEIGNHTYAHTDLTTLTQEEISSSIGETDQLILELVGHGGTLVRPPYGASNPLVEETIATPLILWSVDTEDWDTRDQKKTQKAILDGAYDGAIILMHDLFESTVAACEKAIPRLIRQGYELVTVHELAAAHGMSIHSGILYGEFTD